MKSFLKRAPRLEESSEEHLQRIRLSIWRSPPGEYGGCGQKRRLKIRIFTHGALTLPRRVQVQVQVQVQDSKVPRRPEGRREVE